MSQFLQTVPLQLRGYESSHGQNNNKTDGEKKVLKVRNRGQIAIIKRRQSFLRP